MRQICGDYYSKIKESSFKVNVKMRSFRARAQILRGIFTNYVIFQDKVCRFGKQQSCTQRMYLTKAYY